MFTVSLLNEIPMTKVAQSKQPFPHNSPICNWVETAFSSWQSAGSPSDGTHTICFKMVSQPQLTRKLLLRAGYQIPKAPKPVRTGAL